MVFSRSSAARQRCCGWWPVRWRQRRLTKKSEEVLDKLLEEVFCDE